MSVSSEIDRPGFLSLAASPVDDRFRAAQAGDAQALNEVLRMIGPEVLSTARRVLGPGGATLAEDVAQDSLISLAKSLGRVADRQCLRRYAIKTTVRQAIRARRKARRFVHDAPMQATSHDAVELEAHRRRQLDALLALLDELPDAQAQALFLQVALGQSLEDVAETLGVSTNTVRSRVRLGRIAIRKKLSKRPAVRELLEA